ncbi:MAG: hypothetical protein WBM24_18905 [Candidatus Sulfotelmatobacter sp.]
MKAKPRKTPKKQKTATKARKQGYACSLPDVFKELQLQIEQDVKSRNSQRPDNAAYEFSTADSDDGFRVVLKGKDLKIKNWS